MPLSRTQGRGEPPSDECLVQCGGRGRVRRGWPGPAPTCRFVEVLVIYDDAFAHLLEIHAVQVSGHSVPGGLDGTHSGIFLLFPWITDGQLEAVEAVWAAVYSGKPRYL